MKPNVILAAFAARKGHCYDRPASRISPNRNRTPVRRTDPARARNRNLRTSTGDVTIQVPRDRNGDFQPVLLDKYQTSTNELEDKIIALYAKGVSTRDIQDTLYELYGVEVSAQTISTVTDKVWALVEAWQNRPLAAVYPSHLFGCHPSQAAASRAGC